MVALRSKREPAQFSTRLRSGELTARGELLAISHYTESKCLRAS